MKGIADSIVFLINLLDTDDKRLKICESPKDIFILGFYYSKIEKSIINSNIEKRRKFKVRLDNRSVNLERICHSAQTTVSPFPLGLGSLHSRITSSQK